jgi:hypothetical protein
VKGAVLVRALVLYDSPPDPERFEQHAELCRKVPGVTFRHGRVFAAPTGLPPHGYYAEFEWPDMAAFKEAARTPEFAATGTDAAAMGVSFTVEFVELG